MRTKIKRYSKGIAAILGASVFVAAAFNVDLAPWAEALGIILGTGVTVVVSPANEP